MAKIKHIAGIVLMLTILASCTDDLMSYDEEIKYSSVPMSFAANDDTDAINTRGTQTTAFVENDEFVVNARYFHTNSSYGRDFLSGQKVVLSSVLSGSPAQYSWTYTPLKYWPLEGEMDFYAYSPATLKGTFESLTMNHDAYPAWMLRYKVKDPIITTITQLSGTTLSQSVIDKACDATNQQDLLLCVLPKQVCSEERGISSKVAFSFKHPLAGVQIQIASDPGSFIPAGATHVILSIAPMCAGGTIAMAEDGAITWTLDESEATFYQAYTITGSQIDTDNKTFFLPPQELKNFSITARFYKKESDGTYTLLDTKYSKKQTITLKAGVTNKINIK